MLVELIENDIETERRKQQEFFKHGGCPKKRAGTIYRKMSVTT